MTASFLKVAKAYRSIAWAVPFVLLLACAPQAFAHAILVHSTPDNGAVVHGSAIEMVLDYNSRIDARRSTMTLSGPGDRNQVIEMEASSNPAELKASAKDLTQGTYRIHWQVLASDGHITRGDVTFTVAAK